MRVFHRLEDVSSQVNATSVAIGNFDGCHLGHERLLRGLVSTARSLDAVASVLTFFPHPVEVLTPNKKLERLTTASEKLQLLESHGVEITLVESFTMDLAALSPEAFFERYIKRGLKAKSLHVGSNFRFGKDRAGDVDRLRALCQANGVRLELAVPVEMDGQRVSSSRVRESVRMGDVATAGRLLGRPYSLTGTVARGDGRGKTLGFPTANLRLSPEKLLPKHGVYVTRAVWQHQEFGSVTNVGVRPTFGGNSTAPCVETHLINFEAKLYDETIELKFLDRLRDERAFADASALRVQIAEDVKQASLRLGKERGSAGR